MDWYPYHFVGMHLCWWMFCVTLIIALFWLAYPVTIRALLPRGCRTDAKRETYGQGETP
jgi:hypothetical protein